MDREGNGLGGGRPRADTPREPATRPIETADVETASDGYAARFSGPVGRWLLDLQAAYALELLADLPSGARLLDIGGGHAQLTPALVGAGYEVVVLGSGPEAGRRLEAHLAGGSVRFEVGDLVALPYADRSFDAALSFRLLPHLFEWPPLIAELCRVARRCVIVDFPSSRSVNVLADRLFGMKKRVEKNTRPFTLFHPDQIAAAFARHRFRVSGSRAQFLFPMVLHRMIRLPIVARALEAPGRFLGVTGRYGSPVVVRADRCD